MFILVASAKEVKNTFALCLYTVQELSLLAVKKRQIETVYGYNSSLSDEATNVRLLP